MNDLIFSSATTLAGAVRDRRVSSEELVTACFERIDEVNPSLNAVVQFARDAALERARELDVAITSGMPCGPLHGVPMTIKDSFETAGVVTTAGTTGLRDHVPDTNATVVERLLDAGAVLLGKTNTPEITLRFITENHLYGRTNNPYDVTRTPAGSSGGAAAIVASGGSPLDIGSDTGGSIRVPAAFCGIAGLKPTHGRVPRTGLYPGLELGAAEAFTQVGPMARYVEDLTLLLRVISGPDGKDPFAAPVPLTDPRAVAPSGLRVAYYTGQEGSPPTPETVAAVEAAARMLAEDGASVEEERLPGVESSLDLWLAIFRADGGVTVREYLRSLGTEEMHPSMAWTQDSPAVSAPQYARLLAEWNAFRTRSLSWMEDRYDIMLCPAHATPAVPHEEMERFRYTYPYNLLGWPAGVVRCGSDPEGMPIGVQVVGRPWQEAAVLAVAGVLEESLGGWQAPPI